MPTTANIYVRSRRAGERVMASVSRFLTNELRLKVNEAKSAVARPEERKFLGFSIANDGSERRIAPKALDKFKARDPGTDAAGHAGISLTQLIEALAPYLIGWRGYFGFCQTPRVLTEPGRMDPPKATHRIFGGSGKNGRNRFKELRRRGVSQVPRGGCRRFADRVLAHVQTPGGPTGPAQRRTSTALGLPRLAMFLLNA